MLKMCFLSFFFFVVFIACSDESDNKLVNNNIGELNSKENPSSDSIVRINLPDGQDLINRNYYWSENPVRIIERPNVDNVYVSWIETYANGRVDTITISQRFIVSLDIDTARGTYRIEQPCLTLDVIIKDTLDSGEIVFYKDIHNDSFDTIFVNYTSRRVIDAKPNDDGLEHLSNVAETFSVFNLDSAITIEFLSCLHSFEFFNIPDWMEITTDQDFLGISSATVHPKSEHILNRKTISMSLKNNSYLADVSETIIPPGTYSWSISAINSYGYSDTVEVTTTVF